MGWVDQATNKAKNSIGDSWHHATDVGNNIVQNPVGAASDWGHAMNPVTSGLNFWNKASNLGINQGDINTLGDTSLLAGAAIGGAGLLGGGSGAVAGGQTWGANTSPIWGQDIMSGYAGQNIGGGGAVNAAGNIVGGSMGGGGGFMSSPYPWLMGGNALASLYGSKLQSDAINNAAAQSAQTARDAMAQNQKNSAPWITAGRNALDKQQQLLNDPSSYTASPYSQFLQQQGAQGIDRSAAARGMSNSGNVLADLAKFSQGNAGQGYQQQVQDWGAIAGQGQAQGNAMTGANNALAMNSANMQGNAGMANASNQANMINSLMQTGMQGYGAYQGQQQADRNNAMWNQYLNKV